MCGLPVGVIIFGNELQMLLFFTKSLVGVILAIVDNTTTCRHTTMIMSLSSRY